MKSYREINEKIENYKNNLALARCRDDTKDAVSFIEGAIQELNWVKSD